MKQDFIIILFFLTLYTHVKAQDIIAKTDGVQIKAKVLEINPVDVKYKKFDGIDGPTYSLLKTEISYIQYPNGYKDEFNKVVREKIVPNNAQSAINSPDSIVNELASGMRFETPYKNGKKNGVNRAYYPSGQLFREISYVDNIQNGPIKCYSPTGNLTSEWMMVNGIRNGISKRFNDFSGYFLSSEEFYINDELNGISKTYYRSGKLRSEAIYLLGDINGLYKEYDEQGGVIKSELFKIDISINNRDTVKHVLSYFENGDLKRDYTKVNGKLNGVEKRYYESGALQHETAYVDGKKNGRERYYTESGTLLFECIYSSDIPKSDEVFNEEGKPIEKTSSPIYVIRSYDQDGYLTMSMVFSGQMVSAGPTRTYFKSGVIATELNYENGEQKGDMKVFKDKRKYMSEQDRMKYDEEKRQNRQRFFKDLAEVTVQAAQQASAYQDYQKNPNSQTFSNYANVVLNNYTKNSYEAIKSNNQVLETANANTTQATSESVATTAENTLSGKDGNSPEAMACAKEAKNLYRQSPECQEFESKRNDVTAPLLRLGELAKAKQMEILLQHCNQYLTSEQKAAIQSAIEGCRKTAGDVKGNTISFEPAQQSAQCKSCYENAKQNYQTVDLRKKYYRCNTNNSGAAFACDGNVPSGCVCIAHNKHCSCDPCSNNYAAESKNLEDKYQNALKNCAAACK
jgi:uncharacterized protein